MREPDRLLAGRRFLAFGDNVYLVRRKRRDYKDEDTAAGAQAGSLKKGRTMEPASALALFLRKRKRLPVGRAWDGETAAKYLRGEAIGAGELEAVSGKRG